MAQYLNSAAWHEIKKIIKGMQSDLSQELRQMRPPDRTNYLRGGLDVLDDLIAEVDEEAPLMPKVSAKAPPIY